MAYRTDVTAFSQHLAVRSAELDRLMVLNKGLPPPRIRPRTTPSAGAGSFGARPRGSSFPTPKPRAPRPAGVRAGSVSTSLFRAVKAEKPTNLEGLLALYTAELLRAKYNGGKTSPRMDELLAEMRREAMTLKVEQRKTLLGLADLGEAAWRLQRMWGTKNFAKDYPEFNPGQARGPDGKWVAGSFAGGGGEGRRGMSSRRAELFDNYRLKYGYFPPKGMPNHRIEMWIRDKAPAGQDVTHEVRGVLAEARASETFGEAFQRASSRILERVVDWAVSPVIFDTLVTIGLYTAAVRFGPTVVDRAGLKGSLNKTVDIILGRRKAHSSELIDLIDKLKGIFSAAGAAGGKGWGWFR